MHATLSADDRANEAIVMESAGRHGFRASLPKLNSSQEQWLQKADG
jgi:hypothetical protein